MTKEQAEKVLELPKEYSKQQIRKNFKVLLRKYHPDVISSLSKEEKEAKTKELIEAYQFLITIDQTRISLNVFREWIEELNNAEKIENQIITLSLDSIPKELFYVVKNKYQEFKMLSQITKLQAFNLEAENSMTNMKNYEQKYYQMRFDLTYAFFNYLEKNVQKSIYRECNTHAQNYSEYCKNGSPEILESLYEIVIKFINYFAKYLKEKENIQIEMQTKAILEIEEKRKHWLKGKTLKDLQMEINAYVTASVEKIYQIVEVDPLKIIDTFALNRFLKDFEKKLKDLVESYQIFLESKEGFILELENWVVSQETCKSLYNIEEKNEFEMEVFKRIQDFDTPQVFLEGRDSFYSNSKEDAEGQKRILELQNRMREKEES